MLGKDTVIVTNGGPTEPRGRPAGVTIARDTLAAQNPVANLFGRILLIGPRGRPIPLADTYDFEREVNPDQDVGNPAVDSNPVDVEVDGLSLVFADAGGNALNTVNVFGRVSNLAVFPNRPDRRTRSRSRDMQAVPTSVEVGPDGQYYVSQLTGFPFPVGGANVYRVNPRTRRARACSRAASRTSWTSPSAGTARSTCSRSTTTACSPATATRARSSRSIARGGAQIELPAGTLPFPGGITVGDDGLYVTINCPLARRRAVCASADEIDGARRHVWHDAAHRFRSRRARGHAGRGGLRRLRNDTKTPPAPPAYGYGQAPSADSKTAPSEDAATIKAARARTARCSSTPKAARCTCGRPTRAPRAPATVRAPRPGRR